MKTDITTLPEITVSAERKPKRWLANPTMAFYDFDFYEDKLIPAYLRGLAKKHS